MDVLTAVAPVFGTNCYIVVADDGVSCVVVDVGAGVESRVRAIVAERGLVPVAVLATHGHVDHTWGAAEVSAAFGVPLRLHAADAYRLADPFGTLGLGSAGHDDAGPLAQALTAVGLPPGSYRTPARVETFGQVRSGAGDDQVPGRPGPLEGTTLDLGGLLFAGAPLAVLYAPGHTAGASLFLFDGVPASADGFSFVPGEESLLTGATRTALTGDVLFAGSIGRTDLPGGDNPSMGHTLGELVAAIDPATLLLPGHGPATRMDLELRRNPYLAG
ncbi:MBL fold metallo-hydrolase [Pengzhenrongella frigida]|uniref:MBL fold metallo-hydrolase n=1 Tax=Pengzhenrongella frigida TaxID=1259133 RepID=A0A4Q5N839_9MICO|nr:MBL fold metallo-hydrolase [Cellulomonas sp. HLT2-17]RYV52851.1 MBL fold metallo-hydrolase [Cellulomonas sp. HLT2-17]